MRIPVSFTPAVFKNISSLYVKELKSSISLISFAEHKKLNLNYSENYKVDE